MVVKDKDKKILELLSQNSRMPVVEMSKRLKIPDTTIHFRLKKLKEIIEKFTVAINHEKLGYKLYLVEIEPEKFALEFITEKNIESIKSMLKNNEDVLFIGEVGNQIICIYRGKGRIDFKVQGGKVTRIVEIKNRIGNFLK